MRGCDEQRPCCSQPHCEVREDCVGSIAMWKTFQIWREVTSTPTSIAGQDARDTFNGSTHVDQTKLPTEPKAVMLLRASCHKQTIAYKGHSIFRQCPSQIPAGITASSLCVLPLSPCSQDCPVLPALKCWAVMDSCSISGEGEAMPRKLIK